MRLRLQTAMQNANSVDIMHIFPDAATFSPSGFQTPCTFAFCKSDLVRFVANSDTRIYLLSLISSSALKNIIIFARSDVARPLQMQRRAI